MWSTVIFAHPVKVFVWYCTLKLLPMSCHGRHGHLHRYCGDGLDPILNVNVSLWNKMVKNFVNISFKIFRNSCEQWTSVLTFIFVSCMFVVMAYMRIQLIDNGGTQLEEYFWGNRVRELQLIFFQKWCGFQTLKMKLNHDYTKKDACYNRKKLMFLHVAAGYVLMWLHFTNYIA